MGYRPMSMGFGLLALTAPLLVSGPLPAQSTATPSTARSVLDQIGTRRGLCAVVGLAESSGSAWVVELAQTGDLTVYFQSSRDDELDQVREAASAAGLLGSRVFAESATDRRLHLADNLADGVLVSGTANDELDEAEVLRALRPEGVALLGNRRIVKPLPKGTDPWSHVFHGPDNNPLSNDQLARAPYRTQFLGEPKFVPMPEVSVAAGGRVFRAFGHIAHKANQNAMLNTLLCVNGYNGTTVWRRPLKEGFMIHRNTMIATPDVLYLGDDESCKLLDARTGELKGEIAVSENLSDGPVWKWMALDGGVLYALVGHREVQPRTVRSSTPGMGHWPWGMWEGHDYKDPQTNFGFGRTLLAINPSTKKILWQHREEDYIDARGVCMSGGRLYFYSPGKFLAALQGVSGKVAWKNTDSALLGAIGKDGPAQGYITGYSTATFLKGSGRYLFFAGPQRSRLVVASTEDGRLLWQREPGNLQLVVRGDAVYCAGAQGTSGFKLACSTGEVLASLPARRACTRATGSADSVFFRANEGTMRIDVADDSAKHLAPMRPPCHDGVIISDGMLYWGPWMCGCQLSLYGHVCLAPAGQQAFLPPTDDSRLRVFVKDPARVQSFDARPDDWPTYLGDNARSSMSKAMLPDRARQRWIRALPGGTRPSAPIVAGGSIFVGDDSGAVYAINAADGSLRWKTHTGGGVYFPPALWEGRLLVGSADGRVYALEAATGRVLWRYQAAPADRWIPVYGKLLSTWPVAGGVVVADGVVYAAAGIAHYDGTYVYALDAVTGKMKWCNSTSGRQSEQVDCGISLQGHLYLAEGELRFLGGSKYEVARYDLKTGRCLNPPNNTIVSQFHTAFAPYYPEYGSYTSLAHVLPDGKELVYDVSYEGSQQGALKLLAPLAAGESRSRKPESRWPLPKGTRQEVLWRDPTAHRYRAFVITPGRLLSAGHSGSDKIEAPFLSARDLVSGTELWQETLPAPVVKGGIALGQGGTMAVALEDGHVACFAGP